MYIHMTQFVTKVGEFLRDIVKDRGWRLAASELRLFHELGGIAGTMDALFHEVSVMQSLGLYS